MAERQVDLGAGHARELIEGVGGMDEVAVFEADLIVPETEIELQVPAKDGIHGGERGRIQNGEIVAGDGLKDPEPVGVAEIESARCIPAKVEAGKQGPARVEGEGVGGIAADDGTELTLPDQAVAEVTLQGQRVGADVARGLQHLPAVDLPAIGEKAERGVGQIGLTGIDGIVHDWRVQRDEAENLRKAVVAQAEEREAVGAGGP